MYHTQVYECDVCGGFNESTASWFTLSSRFGQQHFCSATCLEQGVSALVEEMQEKLTQVGQTGIKRCDKGDG